MAERLLEQCRRAQLTVATAESCTGGLIAATLTAVAGSSDVVLCGFVTYSNKAKEVMLDVPVAILRRSGAVSEEVAVAMATGALARSGADLAVAVTGIAGPGGGSSEKPVGLVWIAAARSAQAVRTQRRVYPGDRSAVRKAAVRTALQLLAECLA